MCINALYGLHSFLHHTSSKSIAASSVGVNALDGLLSFLQSFLIPSWKQTACINALNRLHSFIHNPETQTVLDADDVSMP